MTIMRPPQHGQGRARESGSAGSVFFVSSVADLGFGTASKARALATFSARLPLANSP